MGASKIEWTDATWNPVTGCTKVSPGCKNCYAETFAERFRGVPDHPYEQGFDLRLWEGRIDLPLRWSQPKMIFVNSMSDLFHEDVPSEFVSRVFETMRAARRHTFQVLTKRPGRLLEFLQREAWTRDLANHAPNIWLGTSVEAQPYVERGRALVRASATVRFLSCEPLLGPLDLADVLRGELRVDWVIVGGESGHRSRPMAADWVRGIHSQCVIAGVPFFFKQWGGRNKKKAGRLLDGETWDELPESAVARPA